MLIKNLYIVVNSGNEYLSVFPNLESAKKWIEDQVFNAEEVEDYSYNIIEEEVIFSDD